MQTVPSLDLYRELEVDPGASPETIEAAWRSLVKRHHPDVAADRARAVEKIKRLNLAHEWLADRRLREMYDLTRMRRRHAEVTFREGAATPATGAGTGVSPGIGGFGGRRIGGLTLTPSALASTAVVAILVAAALGSAVLNRPAPGQPVSAGPNPTPAAAVAGAVAAPTAMPLPDGPSYEGDLPDGCVANGGAVRLDATLDGVPIAILFVPCHGQRTAGPLIYASDGERWVVRFGGKLERAIVAQTGVGSLTGRPGEYWVAWTAGDGVESWLAVYRIEGAGPVDVWHSLAADLPRWELADYRFQSDGRPRGSIVIVSSDPDRPCRTCPGQRYVEVYEWNGATMTQSYRHPVAP